MALGCGLQVLDFQKRRLTPKCLALKNDLFCPYIIGVFSCLCGGLQVLDSQEVPEEEHAADGEGEEEDQEQPQEFVEDDGEVSPLCCVSRYRQG